MYRYFLGGDVGGTKTRLLLVDESGQVAGFGQAGPGNHEGVGYAGLTRALLSAFEKALPLQISIEQIAGAGFGIGGYDFPSEIAATLNAITPLGLTCPVIPVNDTIIGLLAGSSEGWGVALVSGTGCNCWGWDRTRQCIGRMTGHGMRMGEAAGAGELVDHAIRAVAHQWTRRGPVTELTPAFIQFTGASDLEDLVEGILQDRYSIGASSAPLVFEVAEAGDMVAREVIRWAGCELGEMAKAVIRQLDFQDIEFEVVLSGSMFAGGPLLIEPLAATIQAFAPHARLVRLKEPPVVGAVLLGMEAAGVKATPAFRQKLSASLVGAKLSRELS